MITTTLLILEIKSWSDCHNLLHCLVVLWQSFLAYVSPLLFTDGWMNHRVMFDHIRTDDRGILLLNTVLMFVAWLPFATSVLAATASES